MHWRASSCVVTKHKRALTRFAPATLTDSQTASTSRRHHISRPLISASELRASCFCTILPELRRGGVRIPTKTRLTIALANLLCTRWVFTAVSVRLRNCYDYATHPLFVRSLSLSVTPFPRFPGVTEEECSHCLCAYFRAILCVTMIRKVCEEAVCFRMIIACDAHVYL